MDLDNKAPRLTFAHTRGARGDPGWWEGVLFGLKICGKILENIL